MSTGLSVAGSSKGPAAVGTIQATPKELHANEVFVKLSAHPQFAGVPLMPRGAARKAEVFKALMETAAKSQQPFIELAEKLQSEGKIEAYERLVTPNMLVVYPKLGLNKEIVQDFAFPA